MDIYGIDFTSRPSHKKPITCLACTLQGAHLMAGELFEWSTFEEFEAALQTSGPWIAGIDFPFGQARRFIETIGWPTSWQDYVDHVATMTRQEFRDALDAYRKPRAPGDKEHRRETDVHANSLSPQKLYGTPVGLMFYEGAPRLRRSNVTVPQLQQGDPKRVVIEAYPGALARHLIGKRVYKHDTRAKQTPAQHQARIDLLNIMKDGALHRSHGITIDAPDHLTEDPGADHLDALLCAIQAAWAHTREENNHGAPINLDTLEGWIAEPTITR